ncbi:hypothetical protein ACHAW6_012219 [Cyclotella cf. meneghiniana]
MLRIESNNINDDTASSAPSVPRKPRCLIEVIENHQASASEGSESNRDRDADDDEQPPPIYFHGSSETHCKQQDDKPLKKAVSKPEMTKLSLAEQMMEHADRAAQLKKREEVSSRQKNATKATFGVKKGFLNPTPKSAAKLPQSKSNSQNKQQLHMQTQNNQADNQLIYELDQDGNMTPIMPIPSSAHPQSSSSPLILPEAQNAIASHLQNYAEWATSDLIDSITKKHPKLVRGFGNPKFTAALQCMRENPKDTLNKLKRDEPEVFELIQEFCGVMGEHFVKLGEKQDKVHQHTIKNAIQSFREVGPLEEKALRKLKAESLRKKHQLYTNQSNHDDGKAIDDHVSSILANDDLRSILLDPQMQCIMEECSTVGGKLHYYMRHEEYGPKLRRMMEAGLLKLT